MDGRVFAHRVLACVHTYTNLYLRPRFSLSCGFVFVVVCVFLPWCLFPWQHLDEVGEIIATATDDRLLHDLSQQWGDHQVCGMEQDDGQKYVGMWV